MSPGRDIHVPVLARQLGWREHRPFAVFSGVGYLAMKYLGACGVMLCLALALPAAAALPAELGLALPLLLAEAGKGEAPVAKAVAKPAPKKVQATNKKTAPARKKVASKSKSRKQADSVANAVPKAKLDLSLPKAMVDQLEPETKVKAGTAPKPILPQMFGQKAGQESFELNGRLLSNEMELNLRNEARKDVDGAALDFKFSQ